MQALEISLPGLWKGRNLSAISGDMEAASTVFSLLVCFQLWKQTFQFSEWNNRKELELQKSVLPK